MELRKTLVLKNRMGLHVRPATLLAQKANFFKSNIFLERNGLRANVKSCIELLTLAAPPDTEFVLIANGEDAEQAIEALGKLFFDGFGEPKQ
ncbi:MAG: HPr family phosphocarrier protein [Planctomycetes bacterium]|nr:HPr family phosphocarrier protein [Planctomycetota bacterium]